MLRISGGSPQYYWGIDPGLYGAIAVVSDAGELVTVLDTPIIKIKKGKKRRTEYDLANLVFALRSLAAPKIVGLEQVHSMPGQGVHSMFLMGEGLGIWKACIAMLQVPAEYIPPQRWKQLMLGDMIKGKNSAIVRATRLFPKSAQYFARMKDDGRAEACLIAEYVRRVYGKD